MTKIELWLYRRILRISWVQVEVLRRMKIKTEIILTIKKWKMLYLGHIMRGTSTNNARKSKWKKINRKAKIFMIEKPTRMVSHHLFRTTASKIRVLLMIANLRNEDGT